MMITNSAFAVEPWAIRERRLHLETLAQTESVFALSNGQSACAATSTKVSHTDFPAPT
jgi:Trehalose and maltose hydrolases (possible phosphorylases)